MKKFLIFLLVAVIIVAGYGVAMEHGIDPLNIGGKAPSFSDTAGHWAEASILAIAKKGIVKGDGGKFRPDDYLTRAELVQTISNVKKHTVVKGGMQFTDVPKDAYYYEALNWATEFEIIAGTASGVFSPDALISRQDVVDVLHRYAGVMDFKFKSGSPVTYGDSAEIFNYAKPAVEAFSKIGIVGGDEAGNFRPNYPVTRAELAVMISRMLNAKV